MKMLAGSDAVKGIVNDGMDVEFALKFGKVIGKTYGSPLAVSMDGRMSNVMFKDALTAGMMSVGCTVLDLGMAPTPVLQYYMISHPDVKGGVTITASYAGQDTNGFKILKSGGMEDPIFDDHSLESINSADIPCVPGLDVGSIFMADDVSEGYIESILSQVDVDAIQEARFKVCLDCRETSVTNLATTLLRRLSVDFLVIGGDGPVNVTENMVKLGQIVKSQSFDLGIAIGMDADHCVFATADGRPVAGDKSFAIVAKSILAEKKGKVVIPVNSTKLMEDVITDNGGMLMQCVVGEPMVAKKVKDYEAVFGGDIYGTFVIPDHMCSCDALMAMVKMLECIAKDGPLSEQADALPDYHIARGSVECPNEFRQSVIDKIKAEHDGEEMNLIDGVKFFRDGGWTMVRKSSSDNYLKVYSQAGDDETAKSWIQEAVDSINGFLKN